MMKRVIAAVVLLCLLPLSALAAKAPDKLPQEITLPAGKFHLFDQGFTGAWESSDPAVAGAEPDVYEKKYVRIIGFAPGEATLTLTGKSKTATVKVTVLPDDTAEDPAPESIQSAIAIALSEWEALGEQKLPKDLKGNKYNKWWGYAVGWCGAFAGYCLDQAGIPLEPEDSAPRLKPLGTGEPHSIRAAGVPRLDTAFTNMDRVTKIPRPGYLVIYGSVKDTYGYKHVGLVTDVIPLEDGIYQVSTVEGNMSSTVRRYCYLYDSRSVDHKNLAPIPEEQQEAASGIVYTPHGDTWYVTEFCMTWY